MDQLSNIQEACKTLRYWILKSTSEAGSGHPTSSLSAVELMSVLMFNNYFKSDISDPFNINNDRLIFSKGHASPLFYALWAVAGGVDHNDLLTLRKLNSKLEGHPTLKFPFTVAPTGSLGQGLSIGLGIALSSKYLDKTASKTYVLLGDGELSEGQVWEAAQVASHYKLSNLIAVVDVNRLEQVGETMSGWDLENIVKKFEAFGWKCIVVEDGHDLNQVNNAFQEAQKSIYLPVAIIAKTIKGKGFNVWENELNYHSKTLKPEDLLDALNKLGDVNQYMTLTIQKPEVYSKISELNLKTSFPEELTFDSKEKIPTKGVYGKVLNYLTQSNSNIIALDAGVRNSTGAQDFVDKNPQSFFDMYIAEQNMVGAAIGLAHMNKVPFVSTFGAFFTRAFDQIRMAAQGNFNIKLVGSYAGVSLGMDGQSQMALEDISLARSLQNSVVLYPSDPYAMKGLLQQALSYKGLVYLRCTREATPVVYTQDDKFEIGGFKVFDSKVQSEVKATVIGAGITLHEALKAQKTLESKEVNIQVIDLYSIKPINFENLKASIKSKNIILVEDHFAEGGLGEAVISGLSNFGYKFTHLAVKKQPMSGLPAELLKYEEIDSEAIIGAID